MSRLDTPNVDFADMKVLFVEDNAFARNLGRAALEELGFKTIIAVGDGADAYDTLTMFPDFGLIVSDWNMPKINGLDLFKAARDRWPNIPFLMVTTNDRVEQIHEANEAGVDGYVLKPFTLNILRNKIHAAIRKRLAMGSDSSAEPDPDLIAAVDNLTAATAPDDDAAQAPQARPEVQRLQEAVERTVFSAERGDLGEAALREAVRNVEAETPMSNPHRDAVLGVVGSLTGFIAKMPTPGPTQLEVIRLHLEVIRLLSTDPDRFSDGHEKLMQSLKLAASKAV